MPFGKTAEERAQIPRFGGNVSDLLNRTRAPKHSGGGPRREYFMNWSFPIGKQVPVVFHGTEFENLILDDQGLPQKVKAPFVHHFSHYNKRRNMFCICSAGPFYGDWNHSEKHCSGCAEWRAGFVKNDKGKLEQKGFVNRSENYGMGLTVLDKFYEVPGKPGKKINETTGLPYPDVVHRSDARVPKSEEERAKLLSYDWRRLLFSLSASQMDLLMNHNEESPSINDKILAEHNLSIFDGVTVLEAMATGPIKPGSKRPPSILVLKDFIPFAAYGEIDPEALRPIPLDESFAPASPEKQAQAFGRPPMITSQGVTELVPEKAAGPQQVEYEAVTPDDDIPFLAEVGPAR